MTHSYQVKGMTCGGCARTVQGLLSAIPGVKKVTVDLAREEAAIEMSKHIALRQIQAALEEQPRFTITEKEDSATEPLTDPVSQQKSWFQTYKPVLLIFLFITAIATGAADFRDFDPMRWMQHFMAGFFLAFSFFKFLDLPGFADSYATYDLIARRWRGWGYVYAVLEFSLGMAFLTGVAPLAVNAFTFVLMSVSLAGVLQSVLNRRRIRCACLGTVFNLPMSTITIIEDALMILMSAGMIIFAI